MDKDNKNEGMKSREFTDIVKAKLEDMNWALLGRMQKMYKREFMISCLKDIPEKIKATLNPTNKTLYFQAMCRKKATPSDYLNSDAIKLDEKLFTFGN